jgi:hypothetical protein
MSAQTDSAAARRGWSDQFIPEYLQILTNCCGYRDAREATPDEDRLEATDIVADGTTIACKTRRRSVWERYPEEFALRTKANGPYRSEWKKICDGHADKLLYTFADPSETRIERWWMFDLNSFRTAAKCLFSGCEIHHQHKPEEDVHIGSINWLNFPRRYGRLLIQCSEWTPQDVLMPSAETISCGVV